MPRIVLIDLTKVGVLTFFFLENFKVKKKTSYIGKHPNLLLSLKKFLSGNNLQLNNLATLVLLEGRGSFSGVRQAVANLNIIHLLKKIDVFGLDVRNFSSGEEILLAVQKESAKKHSWLKPIYSGEPNITYSKNKK